MSGVLVAMAGVCITRIRDAVARRSSRPPSPALLA